MQRGLLEEEMAASGQMPPESPEAPMPNEMPPEEGMPSGGSDVDMAVEDAMASGAVDDMGFGTQMASDEEQQRLDAIMEDMTSKIHGELSENVENLITAAPEPFQGISQAAHTLILGSYKNAAKAGLEPNADLYFAENGVIQQSVELVFEFAEAMDQVTAQDDEVLTAAYMDTLRRVGETMLNSENPELREGAQELMMELELGVPVEPEDYAEPSELGMEGQGTASGPQMAQSQSQGASGMPAPNAPAPQPAPQQQGPMPPAGPGQMI